MMRYLFRLPINTYNNENPFYEINPLPNSEIEKSVLFGGEMGNRSGFQCCTYLYLETKKPITDSTRYFNLSRLCSLILLATDLPAEPESVEIGNLKNFEEVFNKFKATVFYKPGVNFAGMVRDANPMSRVRAYSLLLKTLNKKDLNKFENALQTYIWAKEIQRLPDPHLKYTLYMTLFLSSMNQLAENPKPKCSSNLICSDCGKEIQNKHSSSHNEEIEKLIRKLLTGKGVDEAVKLVKHLYHELRSKYLHDGLLAGNEREGGFLANLKPSITVVENMANIEALNRQLLELFLQNKYHSYTAKPKL